MNYEELIKTISEVVNNEIIHKDGLVLLYELDEKNHVNMDEHLFYKSNPDGIFEHREVIEVEIGGIVVRFIKKDLDN